MKYSISSVTGQQTFLLEEFMSGQSDFGERATVDKYNWGGDYRPSTFARLLFLPDFGFLLQMHCNEINPLRVFTRRDEPVYQDSSMEAFLAFSPNSDRPGYVNFEINANGAVLCQYGLGRNDRVFLRSIGIEPPDPEVMLNGNGWGFELKIPLCFISKVFGKTSFSSGSKLKGNFFKIGGENAPEHYGSMTSIIAPVPDFHLPQFFADLVIT